MSSQITTKFSTKFKSKILFLEQVRVSKSKHYFVTRGNCYKFRLQIQNYKHYLNASRNIIM